MYEEDMSKLFDPALTYFPDADDPALLHFCWAFARMMFAHARFEARIRELQGLYPAIRDSAGGVKTSGGLIVEQNA
jgi:hypothetical protein